MTIRSASLRCLRAFGRDSIGASAVEFAIVAAPFIYLILGILQMAMYYMAQSSLDAGVTRTAQILRQSFATASPTFPAASTLKSDVVTYSGGLIRNSSTLAVEIRQLVNLDNSIVSIVDGTVDYGSTTSVLVLRAQSKVVVLAPGLGSLAYVRSSAIMRRQGT
jgi:Flp pilus assembly protein TadG